MRTSKAPDHTLGRQQPKHPILPNTCFFCLWFFISIGSFLVGAEKTQKTHVGLVLRDSIEPNWIDENRFWYSTKRRDGTPEFVGIDAKNPSRVVLESQQELESQFLTTSEKTLSKRVLPSKSNGSPSMNVDFLNNTSLPIRLFWQDENGRSRFYHWVQPGNRVAQSTYAGHSWFAIADQNKPIWTAQISGTDFEYVISKQEVMPPYPRIRRERAPDPVGSPNGDWKAEIRDFNVFFRSGGADSTLSFSTNDFPELVGSKESSYGTDIAWSPNSKYALAL